MVPEALRETEMTKPTTDPSRRVTGVVKPRNVVMGHPVVPDPQRVCIEQGMTITRDQYEVHIARSMSENTWREHIRSLADGAGWTLKYHTYRSDRSDPGWPDDVFYNPGTASLILMEAKRQSGRLSYWQVVWLDALARIRDVSKSPNISVYGGVRPMDRANLVVTLLGAYHVDRLGHQIMPLHQWCLSPECGRCNGERERATQPKPPKRNRQHTASSKRSRARAATV